jgi:hypothetical protein
VIDCCLTPSEQLSAILWRDQLRRVHVLFTLFVFVTSHLSCTCQVLIPKVINKTEIGRCHWKHICTQKMQWQSVLMIQSRWRLTIECLRQRCYLISCRKVGRIISSMTISLKDNYNILDSIILKINCFHIYGFWLPLWYLQTLL